MENGAEILLTLAFFLLSSHPIRNATFTFVPLCVVWKMYEDNKWRNVISNLKHFFG